MDGLLEVVGKGVVVEDRVKGLARILLLNIMKMTQMTQKRQQIKMFMILHPQRNIASTIILDTLYLVRRTNQSK